MAGLIEELKQEHAFITSLLDRARDSSISSAEAHRLLMSAQDALLAHLKKEDLQLYPVLKKAALENHAIKGTVDFYMQDMEEISNDAASFFETYSRDDSPIDIEFARAFGKLFATFVRRIRSEEMTLYKIYEKLNP
ncbi:hemerythrin domain-containing protein [Geomesophilobacter sediminis]|uniref:Hemerythrin domain-containing protein n=1 Tax=Geomesophilobacter sediminis TaxID=2798584 RepID=A0A8J7M327_9BACT|nr:hemerythrin domain-containing protein [Geomesophilobacter sediminis]MBJ6727845.1 hemerythrin domain-containing protein [Geomesophilobacter sediminis]